MKAVFADTMYFVALVNPRDQFQKRVRTHVASYHGRIVTSEFVLIEVANFFSRPPSRSAFLSLVQDLTLDPSVVIVPASAQWFSRGIELFSNRPDKEWSLTDCISFEIMADFQLSHALTADHHFLQAGFTIEFP
jgi:predicted nucleic acid-binding protein